MLNSLNGIAQILNSDLIYYYEYYRTRHKMDFFPLKQNQASWLDPPPPVALLVGLFRQKLEEGRMTLLAIFFLLSIH